MRSRHFGERLSLRERGSTGATGLPRTGRGYYVWGLSGSFWERAVYSALVLAAPLCLARAQEAASPPPAEVQQQGTPSSETGQLKEVVVTGTLIRGIAPVGTNVIDLSSDKIAATGAATIQDVMATVPQMSNLFNQEPTVAGGAGLTIIRPNIRNLADNGGNTTLVLLDGHNMVGAGALQTTPDIGLIPPGALERIEVVPDGGSALYGSDAIGGIVNLITRTHFNGLEVVAHGGHAADYRSGDINITGGHSWGSGSYLLSYEYKDNTDLLGRFRGYNRQDLAPFGGTDYRGNDCNPGNITAGGVNYALPGLTPGVTNLCDQGLWSDIYSEQHQNTLFGRITQVFTETTSLDVSGYYTRRIINTANPQVSSSGSITAANPYFQSIAGETSQQVAFSYAGAPGLGESFNASTALTEYGVTPQLVFRLNDDWEVTALTNFGESIQDGWDPTLNAAAQSAALAQRATALDPYDVAASNPAVLEAITNYGTQYHTVQKLAEGRVIANGALFTLPGGKVRLATGGQFQYSSYSNNETQSAKGDFSSGTLLLDNGGRRVEAVFGELYVPLVGEGNTMPFMRALELDVSGRYDHYGDFGGTTNPKIGITYKPVRDLTIRGNFGTSFNAPSLADELGGDVLAIVPVSPFQKSFSLANLLRPTWVIVGVKQHLEPQTAHTFSVGGDYRPSSLPGLKLSMTYWNVNLDNVIEVIPFTQPEMFTNPGLEPYVVLNPTLAQATAFINQYVAPGQLVGGQGIIGPYYAAGAPYAIFDAQRVNLGTIKTNGLDFDGQYVTETPIGVVSASLAGTLTLKRASAVSGGPPVDALQQLGVSPLQFAATLGDAYGNFTARAMLTYSAGYPVVGVMNQSSVSSFHPVNLYFAYDLSDLHLKNTTISLNVDNVANESPPFYNVAGSPGVAYGTANGQTLGRYIELGIRTRF